MRIMQKHAEEAILIGQECLKEFPVVVLGSSASIPYGLPSMPQLATHLTSYRCDRELDNSECKIWEKLKNKLQCGEDLETALNNLPYNQKIHNHIKRITWYYISKKDQVAFQKHLKNRTDISGNTAPLVKLFKNQFTAVHKVLSVVTTNYDRQAEYAADFAGYKHYTGFSYGYYRTPQSNMNINNPRKSELLINIWKVHGCLDWFTDEYGGTFAITTAKEIPANCQPAIVTPGATKYAQVHHEPFRSVIAGSDKALTQAKAYLCIGYGFNDDHIHPKLMQKWQRGGAIIMILTKELSEKAKKMLNRSNTGKYLALEEHKSGTKMRSYKHTEPVILPGVQWWQLSDFLSEIT